MPSQVECRCMNRQDKIDVGIAKWPVTRIKRQMKVVIGKLMPRPFFLQVSLCARIWNVSYDQGCHKVWQSMQVALRSRIVLIDLVIFPRLPCLPCTYHWLTTHQQARPSQSLPVASALRVVFVMSLFGTAISPQNHQSCLAKVLSRVPVIVSQRWEVVTCDCRHRWQLHPSDCQQLACHQASGDWKGRAPCGSTCRPPKN